ncbi:MAG TPA: amidohydrolase family protein [Pyrinomonadaceae bacterium]
MKRLKRTAPAILVCLLSASTLMRPAPEAAASGRIAAAAPTAHPSVQRFVGGLWFDGRTFAPRTVYSVNGVFRSSHAGAVDATHDLSGKFVVPPFAEAHNHHFMEGMDYRSQIAAHLAQGIFYAKNSNTMQRLTDPVRPHVNTPESVDVLFAGGGLTATGGHPVQIYDHIADRKMFPGWGREEMKNQAYFIIDTERDLEDKWPLIKAGRPDFIKTYLEYSEEYERRKSDPKFYGQRGLDPKLLPKIVAKAHRERLRVAVHVNTAADFRNALSAGADEIAHLPLAPLTEEDARRAARQGTVVVTTTLSHRRTDHVTDLDGVHRHNLRLLHAAGVRLAVGTDDTNRTALDEAMNLARLGVFDNATLLRLWTEVTPQAIFPARKLGLLKDGYEASFLALNEDPLENFANVKRIAVRFKQGHNISPAAHPERPGGDAGKPANHP